MKGVTVKASLRDHCQEVDLQENQQRSDLEKKPWPFAARLLASINTRTKSLERKVSTLARKSKTCDEVAISFNEG